MFRTTFKIPFPECSINHATPVLTIGSCFSDCIGEKFRQGKFQVLANPFGTVYNPASICKLLSYALDQTYPKPETYLESQQLWGNYDFHSSFSTQERHDLEAKIKNTIVKTGTFLSSCNYIIITFGTAFVYQRTDNGEIVANCHKIPANQFTKYMLSQKEIISVFERFYNKLKTIVPNIRIILTVSPVRHIKDTIPKNAVSKSVLRIACDTLEESFDDVEYFPSYEIMMDDLRDYRFYKSDMIHPNDVAETYIWTKFGEAYFEKSTHDLLAELNELQKAVDHKPFKVDSYNHQLFLRETIKKLEALNQQLDMNKEIEVLRAQLL